MVYSLFFFSQGHIRLSVSPSLYVCVCGVCVCGVCVCVCVVCGVWCVFARVCGVCVCVWCVVCVCVWCVCVCVCEKPRLVPCYYELQREMCVRLIIM